MQEKGIDKQDILNLLEEKLKIDNDYRSGFILGSMCTDPLEFGQEVYAKYFSKNLGDPGLFPGTQELERDLISELGELFNGKEIIGTFTSGGTEANIIAMRIAKKLKPNLTHPEILVPASAHASFDKAGDLLGLKVKKVPLREDFTLNLEEFESMITQNTCGVVGIAGTTSLGLLDPIDQMAKIIEGKDLFFHVDAAFGGFILPFLEELGASITPWDFRVERINSLTCDPHKMGLGVIPSGGFFIRQPQLLEKAGFEIPYLAGGNFKHFHIIGTRPGAPAIAFWAILNHLGMEGFKNMIQDCMEKTDYLACKIRELKGIKLAAEPLMNVVGITTLNGTSINQIDMELRKKGWLLGKFKKFNLIRVVVMPHVTKEHLSGFIEDLKVISKKFAH